MRYHHVAVIVSDADRSLTLYRDILGFEVRFDTLVPNEHVISGALLDQIFGGSDVTARSVMMRSPETGTMLEILQPIDPPVRRTPPENLRYRDTGFHELAFAVTDIDDWFERIRAAGYETQTDHVWQVQDFIRSFMFYDPDGNMVQFCEDVGRLEQVGDKFEGAQR